MNLRSSIATAILTTGAIVALSGYSPSGFDIVATPLSAQQSQTSVNITLNTGSPHLGVPDFSNGGGDAEVATATKQLVDVLWTDLNFEREYFLIDRKASSNVPVVATPDALPFDKWGELGADFVLMGTAKRNGDALEIDVRIIGARGDVKGQQLFGQHYGGCTVKNWRYCAHYMSDDILKQTRGVDGVARTRLLFSSDRDSSAIHRGDPSSQGQEIYLMDYDGQNQQRVTANRSLNIMPAWAPDGKSFAYLSYLSGFEDIYIQSLTQVAKLVRPANGTDRIQNDFPAFSPDGKKLAYTSTRGDANRDVFVANADGSGQPVNITPNTPRSMEQAPSWSPSGTQIAFTSDRAGSNQIYLTNADGTGGVRQISFGDKSDRPTFSVDGKIAYTCGPDSAHDICLIDLATQKLIRLTNGIGDNGSPSFSPNGRHVAFVTTRWGKQQIAIVDIDGNNVRQITTTGNNKYPAWSSLPGR